MHESNDERDAVYFENNFPESDVIRTANFLRWRRNNVTTRKPCDSAWHMSRKRWYLYLLGPAISDTRDQLKKLLDGIVEFNSRGEITRIISSDIEKTTTYGGSGKFFITNTIK